MLAPSTVVVGAGPAGLAAAYLLHENGAHVTLIERAEDPCLTDPNRAFSYLITKRGLPALKRMHLEHTLAQIAAPGANMPVSVYQGGANPRRITIPGINQRAAPQAASYWIARSTLVRLMLDRVRALPRVDIRLGQAIVALQFTQRGARVSFEDGTSLDAAFVLGADGLNSTVRQSLATDPSCASVISDHGFGVTRSSSPAVGLHYKTIVLGPAPRLPTLQPDGTWRVSPTVPHEAYVLRGVCTGVDHVRLGLLPVDADARTSRCGTIPMPGDRALWKARTAEDVYEMFQRNFPHIDVRALVPHAEMSRFAAARTARFPHIQRVDSLVGTVGKDSGVALVGDAAHAFPPDLGQGVNAALEDVMLLVDAFARAESVCDALRAYEKERHEDVNALMRLMQIGNPYQYRQNMVGYKLCVANQILRMTLNQMAPQWFYPQIFSMMNEGRYRDVLRRAHVTTMRIWALGVACVAAVAAATAVAVSG